MRKIGLAVLATLLLATLAPAAFAAGKPLVVVLAKGMLKENIQLKWMMGNITEVEWKVVTETLTYDDLKGAKMLIIVFVDSAQKLSASEIDAIKKWLAEGGKTLWVCGDSDYKAGDYRRIDAANQVLEAIGSCLRFEHREAVDRKSNCGKPYRVAAIIEPDKAVAFLKEGVTKPVLFHGPGLLIAYKDGKWYKLEKKVPKGVYRIAWTSEAGAISEFVKGKPEIHDIGEEGRFVLMAAEVLGKNLIIASAEAPFDHYRGMWTTEYHGVALDGPTFVKNVVLWGVGLKGKIPGGFPAIYVAIAIVVIVVIAIALIFVKRGKAKAEAESK